MGRIFRLLLLQLKTSIVTAAAYRWEFLLDGLVSMFWAATAVIPVFIVYGQDSKREIPGWNFGECLVVIGFFILLQGILDGVINPGLQAVVQHIRAGTFDFFLMKPVDAQFLVSTSKFNVWRVFSLVSSGIIFAVGFSKIGHAPNVIQILGALALLLVSTCILYSIWILVISSAFFFVKVDNLTYLLSSIFDAARWPRSVFPQVWRFVFTFILPLGIMTTFPAEALLGRLDLMNAVSAMLGAVVFFVLARWVWLQSLARYTSAGG
jgi:ABC-2 type transport system permease protein